MRDLLTKQRTMLINAIRGHAAEFGVTAAKGPEQVPELRRRLATDEGVPVLAREMISMLASPLDGLGVKRKAIEARLMAWHRQDQASQCLATIPGVGPIGRGQPCPQGATPQGLWLGPALCRLGRHHAARGLDRGAAAARQDQQAGR